MYIQKTVNHALSLQGPIFHALFAQALTERAAESLSMRLNPSDPLELVYNNA